MKKNLPLILIAGGLILLVLAVFVALKSFRSSTEVVDEPEVVQELPESQWPVLSLSPVEDDAIPNSLGHLLNLKVEKINVPEAASMDYLLVYSTSDGGQQGVPGTIQLSGSGVDKNLLLGSESSGKYRFDAGVSKGSITITFRNSGGKSLGKLQTDFHLQSNETELTSVDGSFKYMLEKPAKGVYFVTLKTYKEPEPSNDLVVWQSNYGVFSSDSKPHPGSMPQ